MSDRSRPGHYSKLEIVRLVSLYPLTSRQKEIFFTIVDGNSIRRTASMLGITKQTVYATANIVAKVLGLGGYMEFREYAEKNGLVEKKDE